MQHYDMRTLQQAKIKKLLFITIFPNIRYCIYNLNFTLQSKVELILYFQIQEIIEFIRH